MTWLLEGKPLPAILVSRLRYLGDIVMATVVLEALKRGDPGLKLGFLCESAYAPVLEGHPQLDRLHRLNTQRRGRDAAARRMHPADPRTEAGYRQTVRDLRAERYDLAVDLFFNPRSAVLLKLSGIAARIGGSHGWRRRLYTHTVYRQTTLTPEAWQALAPGGLGDHLCRLAVLQHQESGLDFVSWLSQSSGGLPLKPFLATPDGEQERSAHLQALGVDPAHPYLVLAPGATWHAKEWPSGRWRQFVALLVQERTESIILLLPPGGDSAWAELGTGIPAGRGGALSSLDLPRVMEIMAHARGVVCPDGGVMHVAVGLGVPTVALFGPTDPRIWFPYQDDGRFRVLAQAPPCHPCHLHECRAFSCLPAIGPVQVGEALSTVLACSRNSERRPFGGVEPTRGIST